MAGNGRQGLKIRNSLRCKPEGYRFRGFLERNINSAPAEKVFLSEGNPKAHGASRGAPFGRSAGLMPCGIEIH
jgi:hypothetical protein